jgi:hypothetical protein
MLRVNYNGDFVSAVLNASGFSETYIRNPDLNYLGTNNMLSLNLDNSIKRLLPNASLSVTDSFRYTPLPPGFVNPVAGTIPSDPGNIQSVYAQGFLAGRTNNLINNGAILASYATTATTSLTASYTHAMIRFGSSPSTQGLTLLNSTTQTGTVAGTAQLSGVDAINIRYAHTQIDYTPSGASSSIATSTNFITDIATIGWSRRLTPNLSAELGGGGILISPGTATYAANAALIVNSLNNSATISYSRSAFPNISSAGTGAGVLIGDLFLLSAVQRIDRQWQLTESASYAHTSGTGGVNPLTYDSFAVGGDLQYWMTNIWSTGLNYSYSKFISEFGSTNTDIVRQTITLSVRAIWE